MKPRLFSVAQPLIGILAIAWPLGIYQHLPLTQLTAVATAGAALVVLWLVDLIAYRRPRLPFELFWPAALIAAISMSAQAENRWQTVCVVALFFSVLHFARNRTDIERLLTWSALACAVAAAADLAFRLGNGGPTAYALPLHPEQSARLLDAASATSGTLANGAATLLTGMILWAVIAFQARTRSRYHLASALLGLGVMASAFALYVAGIVYHVQDQPTEWISGPPIGWLLGGLAVWLGARVGAKILVERSRRPDGRYLLVGAPLIALAVVTCFVRFEVMAWHAWAAALAAGYVIRDKQPAPSNLANGYGTVAVIALVPVILTNIVFIGQTSEYHGHKYEQELRADYKAGNRQRIERRLAYWDDRIGQRTVQAIWRARLALDDGRPELAAAWMEELFNRSSVRFPRWPIPTPDETQALLNRLRDHVSAIPEDERGLAYERALAASRDSAAAEASLRQRIAGANPVYEEIDRAPLQHAAEFLVGRGIRSRIDLSDWSVAELIAVLNLSGASIEPAPDEIDRSWLPAAIAVRRDANGITLQVESVISLRQTYGDATISLSAPPAEFAEAPWRTVALPFDASWQITLHTNDENAPPIATVTLGEDGHATALLFDPLPDSLPDQSAAFIWLP